MGQLHTRNVEIHYSDTEDGLFRAKAIAQSCESDIAALAKLFQTTFDIPGLNQGGVRVYVISPPSGGASNTGWGGLLGASDMDINGDYVPPKPSSQGTILRNDQASLLFSAELCEILMDLSPSGWISNWSDGEALSIVLATELYTNAYYQTVGGAPRVNPWLQSERRDWISSTEVTDQNIISYGCGILFLNYLRFQLGFSLSQIIAARPAWGSGIFGHVTLADRFAVLTGKPASQGYPEFMALLEQHLPADQAAQCFVGRDNIFPLRDAAHRSVYSSDQTQQLSSARLEPSELVTLKPGILCGEGVFRFWRVEEANEITISASCAGFAMASFRWTINGASVGPGNQSFAFDVASDIVVPHSNRTVTTKTATGISIAYSITTSWNRSNLKISNLNHDGTYKLDIGFSAHEQQKNDGDLASNRNVDLPTLHFEDDGRFADAQRLCNGELVKMSADLQRLSAAMQAYKNAPDPQPDQCLGAVLAAAVAVKASINHAAEKMGKTGSVFLQEFSRPQHLAAEVAATRNQFLQARNQLGTEQIDQSTKDTGLKPK